MILLYSTSSYAACPRVGGEFPDLSSIETLTLADCSKKVKRKSFDKACECEEEKNADFKFSPTKLDEEEKLKQKVAEQTGDDLKKGLLSISNKILSLKNLGYTKKIQSCTLTTLKDLEKSCSGNNLYQYVKSDNFNFQLLAKNIEQEIGSQNNPYDKDANYLYDRSKFPNSCSINDITVNKIFHLARGNFLSKQLKGIVPIDPEKSLEQQINEYLIENSNDYGRDLQNLKELVSDPYFYKLTHKMIPPPTWSNEGVIRRDENIINDLAKDLEQECSNIFNIAKETLCSESSLNTMAEFGDFRKALKNEDDAINKSHMIKNYCVADKNPEIKKIKDVQDEIYHHLPSYIKNSSAEAASIRSFGETQNLIRKEICGLIPPQGDLAESVEKCKDDMTSYSCEFLNIYKDMIDKEFDRQYPATELAELTHEDGTKFTEDEIKAEVEKRKKDFTLNFDSIIGEIDKVANGSELMSHFLGNKPAENTNVDLSQTSSGEGSTSPAASGNGDRRKNNNSGGGNLASGRLGNNGTNGNKGANSIKKSASGTVEGPSDYDAYAAANSYFDDVNDYSAKREEINKELVKRMFKPKSKGNAFDDALDKPTYVNGGRKKKLSRKERKQREKMYEDYRKEYLDDEISTSIASTDVTDWDEDALEESQFFDQGLNHGTRRDPASYISSGGRSNGPGFYKDAATGEVVKTPTLAMDAIPNSGFAGTGINAGANELDELTQITLYGTLAEDLASIDPNTVEVIDANNSELVMKINSLVQNKEPFVLKNQYDENQKVLVKFNDLGGFHLFVKDETTGKYKEATNTSFSNSEYEAFYRNIQKAFNQNFIAKFTKNTH